MNATFVVALSSSYYPGETAIRIDSYPAGGLFLAITQTSPVGELAAPISAALPVGEPAGHLWYDSGIAAPISATLLGLPLCQGGQDF